MQPMALDWSNEPYVRAYTRDTGKWLRLSWQARALFWELLRKSDRSGVLEATCAEEIAALIRWPDDVCRAALEELLTDGCVSQTESGYFIRNYLPAQEASRSDAQRQRESRERRRLQQVTDSHEESRPVTDGHSVLCSADPSVPAIARDLSAAEYGLFPVLWSEVCQVALTDAEATKQAWELCKQSKLRSGEPNMRKWTQLLLGEFMSFRRELERDGKHTPRLSVDRFVEHFNRCEERARKRLVAPVKSPQAPARAMQEGTPIASIPIDEEPDENAG